MYPKPFEPPLDPRPKRAYPILSYPILSYPILSYPILSYPILIYLIVSYPTRDKRGPGCGWRSHRH
jgi:hypothetical protein